MFAHLRFAALCLVLFGCVTPAIAKPPNIVFLLADDLGWTGLGCAGSDFYETPHLDALARSGLRFTDAYAACTVCSPTRAAIMTGQYPARLRLTDFIAGQNRPFAKMRIPDWQKGLRQGDVTLAEMLAQAGYQTGMVGKWHLDAPGAPAGLRGPAAHGFDFVATRPPKTRGYRLSEAVAARTTGNSDYLTDYLTDRAIEFLDRSQQTESDQPFFLYFAYHVPHTPIQGRADLVAKFEKRADPNKVHHNPTYAAMVASLDESVGRLMERLQKLGVDERTLVIFTSDNGGLTQRYGKHDDFTENLPLRRGKGSAYEGGVRVPTIIRWPGVTPAGAICDTPIHSIDFFPTLQSIAAADRPAKVHRNPIDGVDLTPLLRDPQTTFNRDLFWHYPHYHAGGDGPYSAVRSGDWRLIEFHEDGSLALYNLANDLSESHNLVDAKPRQTERLQAKLDAWRAAVDAQMPTPNPAYDPTRATLVRRRPR